MNSNEWQKMNDELKDRLHQKWTIEEWLFKTKNIYINKRLQWRNSNALKSVICLCVAGFRHLCHEIRWLVKVLARC